ncbi:MAG: DNA recombination protein RmuC [Campylobacterales bacterium]|nr:DNA recombination protein RmuC [Campylobacterales bacterium]
MVVELITLLVVLLLLSIGLIIKLIYQNHRIDNDTHTIQSLSLEIAQHRQKTSDQSEILEERSLRIAKLEEQNRALMEQHHDDKVLLSRLQTKLQSDDEAMQKRLDDIQLSRQILQQEFAQLANSVLIASQKSMSEQNQASLKLILTPLKEQINGFKSKVEALYIDEAKERGTLQNELQKLQMLNAQMSQDAINLTNALKGQNKLQGSWGEMVLERILESSGLRLGHEYERERVLKSSDGTTYRPDVIVKLPAQRDVIIDAKTSLKDYEAFMSHQEPKHLKAHTLSIKNHIKMLSQKRYEELEGINSLDFILMFIPISHALTLALENDTLLYEEAFKQRVVLVSPDTLLLSLRAIENVWRYEKQAKNAIEVTRLAQKLYLKVKSFVDDLDKLGTALQKAQTSYNDAYAKLYSGKDNIIRQIETFKTKANIHPKESIAQELLERSNEEIV